MSGNTLKLITLADVADYSPEELKARIEKKKREYTQMLEMICPSKDIRALAKRIAKRKCPCDKCAYFGGYLCMFPYSDGYIEDMEIDPCYEGVLLFLRNEMADSADCGIIMKLRHELDEANDAVCAACATAIAAADVISTSKNDKPGMQEFYIAFAENIRSIMRELLNNAISRGERIEVSGDSHEKEATSQ